MRKFLKSSDVYNGGVNAPNWSDTEGFYKRVHWLATESHSASNDDEDVIDYFMSLEQLHIEIYGAITNKRDREDLEITRIKVRNNVYNPRTSRESLATKREIIRPYHLLITFLCHKYGLFLRKTLKETLDDWEEEQYKESNYEAEKTIIREANSQDLSGQFRTIQKLRL